MWKADYFWMIGRKKNTVPPPLRLLHIHMKIKLISLEGGGTRILML